MKKTGLVKRAMALLLSGMLLLGIGGTALGEAELSYEGTVIAGETIPVTVPFGGRVSGMTLRAGGWTEAGDVLATIQTTLNYAPVEGTITGLYAQEGDGTESVTERYGAVLYIEPIHKYTLAATSEKAYNSSENYFIHLGERVYLSCSSDGTHQGTGIVSALTDSGYNIEVTGGEFYLNEKVDIYRKSDWSKESRIGRGTVSRAKPVAVKGSGSILKLHVQNGDFVERGEVLFETVEGVLDGLYAPDNRVLSPMTGVVSSVDKNTGDNAAKGDSLVKIIPAESFQVQFSVPEADLFTLTEGMPVSMELYWDNDSGETYQGTITSISHLNAETKEATDKKTYTAYVSFTPDERIRLGMTMILYPGATEEEAPETAEAETSEATSAETAEENHEETTEETDK